MNRKTAFAGAFVLMGVGLSAAAVADRPGASSEPQALPPRVAPTTHVDRAVEASFGVLRRDRTAADINAQVSAAMAGSLADRSGANAAMARLAVKEGDDALYAIPGVGSICSALASEEGVDVGCTDAARAKAGYRVAVMATRSGTKVYGLAPDGVPGVTVTRAAGGPMTVDVVDNGYIADVEGPPPTALSYETVEGPVHIPLPDIAAMSARP
jgi:hypothetical protein